MRKLSSGGAEIEQLNATERERETQLIRDDKGPHGRAGFSPSFLLTKYNQAITYISFHS